MDSFIRELFFGNIQAQGHGISNERYQQAIAAIEQNERRLMELLGEEERKMVLNISNSHSTTSAYELEHRFTLGFRLGARFMLDALSQEEDLLG